MGQDEGLSTAGSRPLGAGRPDDGALLSGQARYADDLAPPGQLHLVFLRSPHAQARLLSIDTRDAARQAGVVAIFTAADLRHAGVPALPGVEGFDGADGAPARAATRYALAEERVGFCGEAVAAVVAQTAADARRAADAIELRYEVLPAVVELQQAEAAGDRLVAHLDHGDPAAVELAFAAAAHRVELELVNQRLAACSMEPRTLLANFDPGSGRLTVDASTQMPSALRDTLAALLPGLGADAIRVRVPQVGGGFGLKTGLYPEDLVVCFASRALGRPVKWCAERTEDLLSALHARDLHCQAEMALDARGRVLALRLRGAANVGAYPSTMGVAIPLAVGPVVLTSVYDIGCVDLRLRALSTDTAPTGAYRGAGQPEFIHVIERLMDAAARQLGLDAAELRRRNLIRSEQMPYRNALGQCYDSGDFAAVLDSALVAADWAGFAERQAASRRRGRWRGRGVCCFLTWTGAYQLDDSATLRLLAEGRVELLTTAQEMGQGIAASYVRLAVEVLELPAACLQVVQGDTDRVSGFGSGGSRSLFTGGAAVQAGAQALVAQARALAAARFEVAPADVVYRAGRLSVAGTDIGIGLFELAGLQPAACIEALGRSHADGPSWPNACHVCELEIDPGTGAVELQSYLSVNDLGRVVHPAVARGQIEGAIAQGIGQALWERIVYAPDSGQLLSASLLDYALPRAEDLCAFETRFFAGAPCLTNALGAKGAGELGTIGATPTVANAVIDALRAAGAAPQVHQLALPLNSERVWRACDCVR